MTSLGRYNKHDSMDHWLTVQGGSVLERFLDFSHLKLKICSLKLFDTLLMFICSFIESNGGILKI